MKFLDSNTIKRIQAELIEDYGGPHGLRDENLLESAIARAQNKALYDDDATVAVVAASMSYGLIKTMPSSTETSVLVLPHGLYFLRRTATS